jgi:hypothetical protein
VDGFLRHGFPETQLVPEERLKPLAYQLLQWALTTVAHVLSHASGRSQLAILTLKYNTRPWAMAAGSGVDGASQEGKLHPALLFSLIPQRFKHSNVYM